MAARWKQPPRAPLTDHFDWREAACKCCGRIPDADVVREAAEKMEQVRLLLGDRPLHVHSWCRCPAHNRRVGGAPKSCHLLGVAVDFTMKHLAPPQVQARLADHDGGLGSYPGFTHVDFGPKRRWEE